MSSGLLLDNDTIGLWGFDEPSEVPIANYATVTDLGPNGLGFTDTGDRPIIVGALGGVTIDTDGFIIDADYARWFDGSNDRLLGTTPIGATRAAELTGTFTIQAWVWVDSIASVNTIVAVGGVGETEATNILARLRVLATGRLSVFWESGAGTNREAIQTSGATVPLRQWVHVAVTCVENGGNRDVEFFIDGSSEDTASAVNASGGSSAVIGIGSTVAAGGFFQGRIGSYDIDLTEVSGSELATNAAASDTRFTGPTTNTWMRVNFEEAPSIHDYGPHGLHMAPRSFLNTFYQYGSNGVPRNSSNCVYSQGGTNQGWTSPILPAFVAGLQGAAEWTLEMWLNPDSDEFSADLFGVGRSSGELEADNNLIHVGLRQPGRTVLIGWEEGAGVNVSDEGASELYPVEDDRDAIQIVIVKRSIGGGQSDVDIYRDGAFVETLAGLTDPTGGDFFGNFVRLWHDPFGVGNFNFARVGYLDRQHLIGRELSVGEILALYEQGTAIGVPPEPPDTIDPVVTFISPAPGSGIARDTPITLQAVDDSGTLCNVSIEVTFADGTTESIYNGVSFTPRYKGSVVSAIANGFQFTLRRTGDWPLIPNNPAPQLTFNVEAVDGAGNRST